LIRLRGSNTFFRFPAASGHTQTRMLSAAPAFDKPATRPAPSPKRSARLHVRDQRRVHRHPRHQGSGQPDRGGHEVTVLGLASRPGGAGDARGIRDPRLRPDTLRRRRGRVARGPGSPAPWPGPSWTIGGAPSWPRPAEPFDVYTPTTSSPCPWPGPRARAAGGQSSTTRTSSSRSSRASIPVSRAGFRVLERLLIGRADRVITVNDSIAAELSRRYGVATPRVLRNCPRTFGAAPTLPRARSARARVSPRGPRSSSTRDSTCPIAASRTSSGPPVSSVARTSCSWAGARSSTTSRRSR
jgi:hypothetical protein